jgi:hypothetical protein
MSDTASSGSLLSRTEVDEALAAFQRDEDAISSSLLELEDHPGHLLLKGTALTGVTATKWAAAERAMAAMWQQFAAYRDVLEAARDQRARLPRKDDQALAELTGLLTGPSVELVGEPIPLERRGLLDPDRPVERLTLAAVTARMKDAYESVADVVAAADDAWSRHVVRLTAIENTLRTAREAAAEVGGAALLTPLGHRLERLRRAVAADPLGDAYAAEFDRLQADASALRDELVEADAVRTGFADRAQGLARVITQVEAVEAQTRSVRAAVRIRIAGLVPEPPERSQSLRARLATLGPPPAAGGVPDGGAEGPWAELAGHVVRLENDATAALEAARVGLAEIAGLLARRDELRGRLDAYQAKAARLGHSEDPGLTALHHAAHDLLWRAPCDLGAATRAVARYQRAVAGLGGPRH